MATKTYNTIFKLRRANAADWQPNYVLQAGEPGFELDTGKLKIGDGIKTWSQLPYIQGTSEQGAGTSFEVGDNMLLENGVLKAKYGESVKTNFKLFQQNLDGSNTPEDIEYEAPTTIEEANCLVTQLYDLSENNSFIPIISSGDMELQLNYDNIENTENNIKFIDEMHYNTTLLSIPFYWCGNETGMKYFISTLLENPDDSLLEAWGQEESKWFIVQIDLKKYTDMPAIMTVVSIPLEYYENENEEEIASIQLNASTFITYKLPASALNAGTGIEIDENTSKINISFGEYLKTDFNETFCPGLTEQTPLTKALGQLYCWYSKESYFHNWEENSSPEPFQQRDAITTFFYSKGKKSDFTLNMSNRTNYENYLTDEYYTIPFYFDKPTNIATNPLASNKIELKEMIYPNNVLYTTFASFLDTDNPSANIFYTATVNTDDDVNTIMTNQIINPNSEEPAILFVFLDQPIANQVFIWAFSNTDTLGIDYSNNGKVLIQGEEFPTYSQLPPNWLNSASCSGPKDSIILGAYNKGYEDIENGLIILGNHNLTKNSKAQLVLGKYNNPFADAYFQIGNGINLQNTHNIFEIDQNDIRINGNLYLNNQPLTIKPVISNPGLVNQINSSTENFSDIIDAYNDLATKYNNLINYLQNAGYINT